MNTPVTHGLTPPAAVHVVGAAGVGMSALAQALRVQGYRVSGSDRYLDSCQDVAVINTLRRAGVTFYSQDGTGVTAQTAAVVVSTAIEDDNPDIVQARKLNIPVIHRARMLAHLVEGHTVVAVTGTAGKTTVTGMIGWIFDRLGKDPMVVNGGAVINWLSDDAVGNVRAGHSGLWIIEVDESDRSLLNFTPDWTVITNASKDHFELSEVESLFRQFAQKTKRGVVGWGGPETDQAALRDFTPLVTERGSSFVYNGVTFEIPQLGRHNAENALHSVMLCERMGLPLEAVRDALKSFRGIQRRLELAGTASGVTVMDDYAHNPAKIKASWSTLSACFPRVRGVWRPHGFGPLALMHTELADMFAAALRREDRLFILPVYFVGGTAKRALDSEQFVEELKAKGVLAEYVADYDALARVLKTECCAGDAVLILGARDPELPVFARRLLSVL